MFSRRKRSSINLNSINYETLIICNNTLEKNCIKADDNNNKLYLKAMKALCKQHNKLRKSKINIDINIDKPPTPSNFDRLIKYKKNNILKPSYKQSESTIFLYQKGYILNQDYDACDAIQFAKNLKKKERQSRKVSKKKINIKSSVNDDLVIEPIIINDITPRLNRVSVYPQIRNQPEYIQEINSYEYNDEPDYGFSNSNISKRHIMPSAPPYEEKDYVYNYESKC